MDGFYWEYHPFDDVVEESCNGVEYYANDSILDAFPADRMLSLLRKNPHYKDAFQWCEEKEAREEILNQQILDTIPKNVPDLFPYARNMHRHFILHIGPTNSGKTYNALEALKQAECGVYLAPLRLMAYEAYENFSQRGFKCEMIRGRK